MPLLNCALNDDAGQVVHRWSLAVPAERVWWGLTDADAMPHWLGRLTGGRFVVGEVVTVEHAENYSSTSLIRECAPGALLSMTWKFPDERESYLRVTLNDNDGHTQLDLQHTGLGSETTNYLHGWHTHLLYLESLLIDQPKSMDDFWTTYNAIAET